ncbi:MAG TPA: hypothetical protein PLW44_11340, partial [Chitinophagales bacterium]|nr:hypothetical protein [Chitinophagales bacterium]
MNNNFRHALFALFLSSVLISCKGKNGTQTPANQTTSVQIKEEDITYTADTVALHSYVAYNQNDTSKMPVVIVVPEW